MSDKINPRFAGLPSSIDKSEVLASKYAAAINQAGASDDQDTLVVLMEEWDDHLKREGITMSNKIIETLSEVTMECNKSGKVELAGKLAEAVVEIANNISRQYMNSISLTGKISDLVSTLHDEVDELKRANNTLTRIIPKIKGSRTFKSRSKKDSPAKEKQILGAPMETSGDPLSVQYDQEDDGQKDLDKDVAAAEGDKEIAATRDDDESMEESIIDVNSEKANKMRYAYRKYYSDPEFDSFSQEKQVAVLDYYIEHILSVEYEWVKNHPASYSMLVDLIDKRGMIVRCQEAKAGTLSNHKIMGAVEEIATAITQCAPPYGRYSCSIGNKDSKPVLVLTEEIK